MAEATKVEPALTDAEWGEALSWPHGVRDFVVRPAEGLGYGENGPEDCHRVAALCLHDQPLGFTWEDVDELRGIAEDYEYRAVEPDPHETLNELADRIAALLPPREGG